MIYLSLVCFIIAFIFKALMDKTVFGYHNHWERKYKRINGIFVPYSKKWYHLGYEPKYEEAFPFSTTILVFLTDRWHLYQFVFLRCIYLALAIPYHQACHFLITTFLILPVIYGIVFNTFYR